MNLTIRDMTAQERLYTYAQSQQIRAQSMSTSTVMMAMKSIY